MSKATSSDTSEISSIGDLSADIAVKVQREVHCFQWYTETRWLARREEGGVLYLEPYVRDPSESWRAQLYPESRAHELNAYLEQGDIDIRPRSHLPEHTEPIIESP